CGYGNFSSIAQVNQVTKLYTNDGSGNFTEKANSSLIGVSDGSIAFSDVDRDGDEDLVISGIDASSKGVTKLYTNDGEGNFTERITQSSVDDQLRLKGTMEGALAMADVNGDQHPDLFVMGTDNNYARTSNLYLNDGKGQFTLSKDYEVGGMNGGSAAFADVDSDGDQDLLTTGFDDSYEPYTLLYLNGKDDNGKGIFSSPDSWDSPFNGVAMGSVAFGDIDRDGDQDFLSTGKDYKGQGVTQIYINDGRGNFTEKADNNLAGVFSSSIAFSDTDRDNYPDLLLLSGYRDWDSPPLTKLYTINSAGQFAELSLDIPLLKVDGNVAISEGDENGQLAIYLSNDKTSNLYQYNANTETLTELTDNTIEGVAVGAALFADPDRDGDQDLVITGKSDQGPISKIYLNDGNFHFSEANRIDLPDLEISSLTIMEGNDKHDPYLIITGNSDPRKPTTLLKVYSIQQ
ncbi:MAG: VCBS repeat-containing protein, partial [Bacteroidota bacterium]